MKIKTKITLSTVSALTLGILCYSVAFLLLQMTKLKRCQQKKLYGSKIR